MHRVIVGARHGQDVDHKNNEATLDNQRHNWRICTNSQNQMNAKKQIGCSSQYKGVCWNRQCGKWQARIKLNGKEIWLGYFDDEIEAARVYNEAAIEHFGEFARLNDVAVCVAALRAIAAERGGGEDA